MACSMIRRHRCDEAPSNCHACLDMSDRRQSSETSFLLRSPCYRSHGQLERYFRYVSLCTEAAITPHIRKKSSLLVADCTRGMLLSVGRICLAYAHTSRACPQVMFLWLLAFWALGYFALPNSLDLLGLERGDLSARGQVGPFYVAGA